MEKYFSNKFFYKGTSYIVLLNRTGCFKIVGINKNNENLFVLLFSSFLIKVIIIYWLSIAF
jgi:hypothetical protein